MKETIIKYHLYTDGACLGNPGPGGWAYVLKDSEGKLIQEAAEGEANTTNNRMELTAAIMGLSAIEEASTIELISDSQYVLNGLSQWLAGWKKRGWRKSDKKPVLNAELWQALDKLNEKHNITTTWVRGHTGHPENERCDELAFAEAHKF